MKIKIRGQSTIETAVLIIVIVMALIAMQVYFKRGMQGRMRSNIDAIGEQYDPGATQSDLTTGQNAGSVTVTNVTADTSGTGGGIVTTSTSVVSSNDSTWKIGWEHVSAS